MGAGALQKCTGKGLEALQHKPEGHGVLRGLRGSDWLIATSSERAQCLAHSRCSVKIHGIDVRQMVVLVGGKGKGVRLPSALGPAGSLEMTVKSTGLSRALHLPSALIFQPALEGSTRPYLGKFGEVLTLEIQM